ncbi:MAG TPA: ABC transporter permease subunit, partial [Candidatus Udaeobacter sp.]|nr:ABC transporter permease subunit [Candidatus Udaeobacter sp.]
MIGYALRRLLGLLPLLALVLFLAFVFMRTAPGGPFDTERTLSPQIEQALRARYHLDEPVLQQFGRYLGNLAHGDLGPSFRYRNRSVAEIIKETAPISLALGVLAMAFAVVFGVTAGIVSAVRARTAWDHLAMGLAMAGICIPNFVLGPVLVLVFALVLHWLPPAGWGSPAHLILPAITLGALRAASIARLTRGSLLEALGEDAIRTARAKGLSEPVVVLRHALKLAILPVVSYLGPATAATLSGSVVVERIFLVPGLGTFFVQSALNRDYTVAMGTVLFYSTLLMLLNLAVDLAYRALD